MGYGMELGETCGRGGCKGVIEEHDVEGCSCHIDPPCSACTTPREYCEECDWQAKDDMIMAEGTITITPIFVHVERKPHVWDRSKIDKRTSMHSSSSQKVTGVFPIGTPRSEVEKIARGTFGGRFEKWSPETGDFVYIAYTD